MSDQNEVVNRIKQLMEERGLSKTVFAEKLGVSRNTVYSWFLKTDNKRNMKDPTIKAIASFFGVSFDYLKLGKVYSSVIDTPHIVNIPVVTDALQVHTTPNLPTIPYNESFLKKRSLDKKSLFILKVVGKSWSPVINQHDLLLIDEREQFGNINKMICLCFDENNDYTIACLSKDFLTNSVIFFDLYGNVTRQTMTFSQYKAKVKKCMRVIQIIRNIV